MFKPLQLLPATVLVSALLLSAVPTRASLPPELNRFADALTAPLEQLLQVRTGRARVGVQITPVAAGHSYQLKLSNPALRDTVFELTVTPVKGQTRLSGRVYSQAESELIEKIARRIFTGPVDVQLEIFPYAAITPDYAISLQPGSDLYVEPRAEAGENLATQIRLGTPLEILEYSADQQFARVRILDDGYIAWIQRSHLRETDITAFQKWAQHRNLLLMRTLESPRKLYFGTRLRPVAQAGAFMRVALPDGTELKLAAADLQAVKTPTKPDMQAILKTASQYLPKAPQGDGPYLWGGTFGRTLDCSGFVQTVFRANHVYLPRDADQQMAFTRRVGATLAELHELQPGDLVFFSGNRKYATHVGIYLGGGQIIHSSAKGPYNGIKLSTLQGGGDYDRYLQRIYFGGGRVTRSL
jgi:hypothetical protein